MRTITFSLAALAFSAVAAFPQDISAPAQDQAPAPIQRGYAPAPIPGPRRSAPRLSNAQLVPGVWLRTTGATKTQTVTANGERVELRVDHGIANLNVHHPEARPQILVDLPGGQVDVLKDGLYTFNADTDTVRTLKGEAEIYPSSHPNDKGIKVKEDHAVSFNNADLKPYEFGPMDLRGDLLPGAGPAQGEPVGYGYGYGPYGDGFAPGYYPGYAYGPYWGDPFWGPGWGWGPGFGIGIGYYGGFGGGFGGFHGRR
jgi:hypothetical protein